MRSLQIVYWEEDGGWLGYLEMYPDYWTQGDTLEDLRAHLQDLDTDLSGGAISGVRKRDDVQAP